MKKILLFAGSNSSTSINKKLIKYVADNIKEAETEIINLEDYEPPMFSVDIEKEITSPESIQKLVKKFRNYDGFVVSTPEHNHIPPAFLKSILDWLSRVHLHIFEDEPRYFEDKPLLLLSTSPGKGGATRSIEHVEYLLSFGKPKLIGKFSLPSFNHNFEDGKITDQELDQKLKDLIKKLESEV